MDYFSSDKKKRRSKGCESKGDKKKRSKGREM